MASMPGGGAVSAAARMRRVLLGALDVAGGWSRSLIVVISAALVLFIGVLSYSTHRDLRFSFFYLLPIAVCAWFVGRAAGVSLSILSVVSWTASHFAEHGLEAESLLTGVTNVPILLVFFLVQSLLLSALHMALARERDLARVDPLTGIANRRAFFEMAEAEVRRVSRYGGPLSVVFMDIDDFKLINDRGGHEAGDRALASVARTLRVNLRANDVVARFGGDEFILLLPETGTAEAQAVLAKLKPLLEGALRDEGWPATFSAGCVTFEVPAASADHMVRLADELMYSVKTNGKGRIGWQTVRS
jgi:diguanylate cyclase (GGDEF)-like protein